MATVISVSLSADHSFSKEKLTTIELLVGLGVWARPLRGQSEASITG